MDYQYEHWMRDKVGVAKYLGSWFAVYSLCCTNQI